MVESGKFDWAAGAGFPSLTEPEPAYHGLKFFENFGDFAFTMKARAVALRDFGPALAPMNAFLTITGVETLHVRMERHVANAQKVAEFLKRREALIASLSPDRRGRYGRLAQVCHDIETASADNLLASADPSTRPASGSSRMSASSRTSPISATRRA